MIGALNTILTIVFAGGLIFLIYKIVQNIFKVVILVVVLFVVLFIAKLMGVDVIGNIINPLVNLIKSHINLNSIPFVGSHANNVTNSTNP